MPNKSRKSQSEPQGHKRPALPLEKRLVMARVKQVGPDYCNLELEDGRGARLKKSDADDALQADWSEQLVGQRFKVFMLRPAAGERDIWFVHQAWADLDANPWFSNRPKPGDEIEGVVTRYIQDYAALVETAEGLEIMLHRAKIPGAGFQPINEVIYVGDRVRGKIFETNVLELDIRIDLQPIIQNAVETAREQRLRLREEEISAPEPQLPKPDPVIAGVRLWIIDDDAAFRLAMGEWLDPLLEEVRIFQGVADLRRALKSLDGEAMCGPTHALIDRDLAEADDWDTCVSLLEASELDVALCACSARQGLLDDLQMPALPKPIGAGVLFQYLKGESIDFGLERNPENQGEMRHSHWRDQALDADFRRESREFLELLCRDHDLTAALWVERTRPGFFEPISYTGLLEENLQRVQPIFYQTVAGNVIDLGFDQKVSDIGPLADLFKQAPREAFGISLAAWGQEDHGVVFFGKKLDENQCRLLAHMGPAFTALVRQREMADHLKEVEPFAVLGRFWSGYAHELRQASATAMLIARGMTRWLPQNAGPMDSLPVGPVRERVRELQRAMDQFNATVSYELGRVRKHAPQRVKVVSAVQNLIALVQSQVRHRVEEKAEFSGMPLIWLAERPASDPEVSLDAQALDQPLMNLLDNALYQVRHYGDVGEIQVRIRLELDDPDDLPLWIEVQDNGGRMDAMQRTRLFKPRSSTRGQEGIGMGLYVSWNLVQAVGGDLDLVDKLTLRYLQTVFRLRLPYRVEGVTHG